MKFNNISNYNIEDLRIKCETFEEAKRLLKIAHEKGYKWFTGKSLLEESYWFRYEENTVYIFSKRGCEYNCTNYMTSKKTINFKDLK